VYSTVLYSSNEAGEGEVEWSCKGLVQVAPYKNSSARVLVSQIRSRVIGLQLGCCGAQRWTPHFRNLQQLCPPVQGLQHAILYSISRSKSQRMSRAFTDNINSFNVSTNIILTTPDDEPKILAWLSPLQPQVRHQDICEQRVDTVGNWLLETKEFRGWYNGNEDGGSDHTALFCYGEPGVGKSYIWYGRLLARY